MNASEWSRGPGDRALRSGTEGGNAEGLALPDRRHGDRRMKAIVSLGLRIAVLAAALAPTVAQAGYVNDRRGWQALSAEARLGYVQALNDSLNYVFADDTLPNALAKRGRHKCLSAQKTTAAQLADRITMAYRENSYAALAPTAVYIIKMQEVCRSYINEERTSFGLGSL